MDASVKDAVLKVEFAISDLEKYKEGDWPQTRRAIEAKITIAQEELQRAQDRLNWTKTLEAKGYATKDELKADSLTMKRQEIIIEQADEENASPSNTLTPSPFASLRPRSTPHASGCCRSSRRPPPPSSPTRRT